ncbi:MAG: cold shock domain-containing protein [Sandaracinus sp.]|nr:cold shock domain-containing protein [Sandaracinus sp.]
MQASESIEDGIVKWFNNAKGWGFISRGADGSDPFVVEPNRTMMALRTLDSGAVRTD